MKSANCNLNQNEKVVLLKTYHQQTGKKYCFATHILTYAIHTINWAFPINFVQNWLHLKLSEVYASVWYNYDIGFKYFVHMPFNNNNMATRTKRSFCSYDFRQKRFVIRMRADCVLTEFQERKNKNKGYGRKRHAVINKMFVIITLHCLPRTVTDFPLI